MGGPAPASSLLPCPNTVDQDFPRPERLTAIWKTTQLLPAPAALSLFFLSFYIFLSSFLPPLSHCQDAVVLMSIAFLVVHFQGHNEPCVHNLKTNQPFLCINYWVNQCAYLEVPKIVWQVQRHTISKVFCHNGLSTGQTMKEIENIEPIVELSRLVDLLVVSVEKQIRTSNLRANVSDQIDFPYLFIKYVACMAL